MFSIEILCTGDEILSGKTVNTNYSYIARRLLEHGFSVSWGTTVGDDRQQLAAAFSHASRRADAVIVNGGLGPTVDDLSQEVAAQVAGVGLELDAPWFARIQSYYSSRGRKMPSSNKKQAMLPQGAEVIDNPIGTACGFALTIDNARFFFTPGVPREMRLMLDQEVIPRLRKLSGVDTITRLKRFHTFGIGESRADVLLRDITRNSDRSVKLGFQSHYPQLETKLLATGRSQQDLDSMLMPVETAVRDKLGNFVVAEDEQTIEQSIIDALQSGGGTLSTMEMFTGGAIASRLLPITGTSGVFKRGVVSRDLSQLMAAAELGADDCSASVGVDAAAMLSRGLRRCSGSSHALVVLISLDTVADDKQLGGNIFIAIAHDEKSVSRVARYAGNADWVRLGAIEMGLDCMRRYLYDLPVNERIDFEEQGAA